MVDKNALSPLSSGLVRWCLGIAGLILCGLSAVSAQEAVRLKLDWDLMPHIGTPGVDRARLLAAEAPELRGRILKARDQIAALDESRVEKTAYLNRHEELIQRMNGVLAAQEKVIARLAAEAQQRGSRKAVRPPVTSPPAAPMPRPQATTAMAPIHLGPVELPGVVRNYLLEGAFAGIAVILLGWALYLRSVARTRAAELVLLKGGTRTATPTGMAKEESEAREPSPVDATEASSPPAKKPEPVEPVTAASPLRRSDPDTAPEREWSDTGVDQDEDDADAVSAVDTVDEEQDLAGMSNGPLSGTLNRIKQLGRALMPGHPLFDDDDVVEDEVSEKAKPPIPSREPARPKPAAAKPEKAPEPRKPVAAAKRPTQAPPLILEVEADDGEMDFFAEVKFEADDENDKKG